MSRKCHSSMVEEGNYRKRKEGMKEEKINVCLRDPLYVEGSGMK